MEKIKERSKSTQLGKKLVVYPMLFLLFAGSMWLIFAPDGDDKQQGYNTEVPQPIDNKLSGDKKKIYEDARYQAKQEEREAQVKHLASVFDTYDQKIVAELDQPPYKEPSGGTIESSANAYQDISKTLGSFYEEPKEDKEKVEMQARLDELTTKLEQQSQKREEIDPMALMERSYQLAAKYLPSGQGAKSAPKSDTVTERNGKALVMPVERVTFNPVSALHQLQSDSAFMADYSTERNVNFNTAVGNEVSNAKNTIAACVYENQTITDGQSVRVRLLEPMRAGTTILPPNTLVTGAGKIDGERLFLKVTSIEYDGTIIPVELLLFDSDGQEGIFIPNSMEVSAIKEVASNMGSSLGSTISITNQGAGDQLLSELGKGVIQGVSQYVSGKVQQVRVHLKSGYRVLLYQSKN